jgi:hypothetical protein
VGDEQHGQAEPLPQLTQDRHHLRLGDGVQGRGRLVGQQQRGLGGESGGDHHPLEEAAGQLVGVAGQAGLGVLDAHEPEQLEGSLLAGLSGQALVEP